MEEVCQSPLTSTGMPDGSATLGDMGVCVACTTNPHLKAWIEGNGAEGVCGFCGSEEHAIADVARFVDHVDGVIRRNYSPSDEDGDVAASVISMVAGISRDLASLVTNVTRDDETPGHSFYEYGPLALRGRWPHEHLDRWQQLKQIVKHEARFLGSATRPILDTLLGGLDGFCGGVAIRELTAENVVFRGRLARSHREADEWFKAPANNLNAPPRDKATAGRMNGAGIRVFYGALQERIAVAELRPPIGSYVVVGSFAPTRALRIVDLGVLGEPFEYEDMFSPRFEEVSTRLAFLEMLEQEISLPVQPHDQELEYITTQLVAEYVRVVLGLDGVAYRSAQVGEVPFPGQIAGPRLGPAERNVVLFGTAAMTTSDSTEDVHPGLAFVQGSEQMLDVTKIEISYRQNMWAHYQDPPTEDDEEQTQAP